MAGIIFFWLELIFWLDLLLWLELKNGSVGIDFLGWNFLWLELISFYLSFWAKTVEKWSFSVKNSQIFQKKIEFWCQK